MHSEKRRMENEWIVEERPCSLEYNEKETWLLFLTSVIAVINTYLNFKDDKVNIFCSSVVFSCLLVYNTLFIPYS